METWGDLLRRVADCIDEQFLVAPRDIAALRQIVETLEATDAQLG